MTFGSVALPLVLYGSLNLADAYSSRPGPGFHEGNKLVQTMGMPAAKVAGTLAFTGADLAIKSKKGKWILRLGAVGLYGWAWHHNNDVRRKAAR
jgi:hypothetical protein